MPSETVSHAAIAQRAVSVAISAAIGLLLLTAHPLAVAATCVAPTIWLRQRDRLSAHLCACSYYAAAIWPVISVVHRFNGSVVLGYLIWTGAFLMLSLPWLAFHSLDPKKTFWCGATASLASALPPVGLIGVASPISAAGLLFPGCKILGLFAACTLPGLLAWRPKPAFLLASAAILLTNLRYAGQAPRALDWEAVDTAAGDTPGAFGDYRRIETMLGRAESSSADVIVFPEAAIQSWTPTTLTFFDRRIRSLRAKGKTVLTGAIIPQAAGYRNVVEAFGSSTAELDQQVPVPLGMWRPFSGGGVRMRIVGHHILHVHRERAALLICYEQLIPWPAVLATLERPTVAVGLAKEPHSVSIPVLQRTYLSIWARLWGTSWLSAVSKQ